MLGYLDCSSGISGDKFLGALIDAGFSLDRLSETLAMLDLPSHEIVLEWVTRGGILGAHVSVETSAEQPVRTWNDIRTLLVQSALPERVRDGAVTAFELLAEAEGKVHGVQPEDVHFHEVGALDSIVDIVGVAAGLVALEIDELLVSPVATGFGTVETEHGTLPVPAPATSELLLGVPTFTGNVESELTTPTGAVLVRTFATGFGPMPISTPVATGYGAGTRDLPIPNVARLTIAERAEDVAEQPLQQPSAEGETARVRTEVVAVLEANVDHVTPEQLSFACERLLEEGALDVWQTPIVMKKGRAAVALSVMVEPERAERFSTLVMQLTGTLGVRRSLLDRDVAPRFVATVDTRFGAVRVKVTTLGGKRRVRPEHDDVAAIARREELPYDEVARHVTAEAQDVLGC
jgi:pyridinium-3,5-bisthiocarboxylic acid mononucleotide nickel chelatase